MIKPEKDKILERLKRIEKDLIRLYESEDKKAKMHLNAILLDVMSLENDIFNNVIKR